MELDNDAESAEPEGEKLVRTEVQGQRSGDEDRAKENCFYIMLLSEI